MARRDFFENQRQAMMPHTLKAPGPFRAQAGRTVVLAVGNEGAGDDGFGPQVVRALAAETLPKGVELLDGGVLGIDLLSELESIGSLILVDAIRPWGGAPAERAGERGLETEVGGSRHWVNGSCPDPGVVVVFRLSEVGLDDPDPRFSLHDLSFGGCLRLARLLDLPLPEIHVVGFVLPSVSSVSGPGLSLSARRAVPEAVESVLSLCRRS